MPCFVKNNRRFPPFPYFTVGRSELYGLGGETGRRRKGEEKGGASQFDFDGLRKKEVGRKKRRRPAQIPHKSDVAPFGTVAQLYPTKTTHRARKEELANPVLAPLNAAATFPCLKGRKKKYPIVHIIADHCERRFTTRGGKRKERERREEEEEDRCYNFFSQELSPDQRSPFSSSSSSSSIGQGEREKKGLLCFCLRGPSDRATDHKGRRRRFSSPSLSLLRLLISRCILHNCAIRLRWKRRMDARFF